MDEQEIIEDHFPVVSDLESTSLTDSDPQVIADKITRYEQLET